VVVVAAELGHGKRNNVLSDYTFAVRDETTGELLPIGKAYSGLTDVEIAELTEHFKQNTIADHGRYRRVNPMSCSRWLSIQSSLALATPVDSHCVSQN
jgi:ATP-dependent DNA ligase